MVSLAKDPKYLQMAEKFRNDILSGVYQQGSRLPSDEAIANAYGINKRTVAAGMAQLVAEGLISRTPGRGSIVVRQKIVARHTNAVVCASHSGGAVYGNMETEIIGQALKRGFYPIWVPPTLFNAGITNRPDSKQFYQFMEHAINNMPYGMVVFGERFIPYDMLERNLAKIGKLVFICNYVNTKDLPAKYVLIDYDAAAQKVVSHFRKKGHRKMTFLGSPVKTIDKFQLKPPQYHYHLALKKACLEQGLEYDEEIPFQTWNAVLPQEIFRSLPGKKITAAALSSDSSLNCLYERDCKITIRVPEDLSVIGFYDTYGEARPITSFNIREREIATIAMEMLFEENSETKKIYIEPDLIDRGSVLKQ